VPEIRLSSGRIADLVEGRLVGRNDVHVAGVAPLEAAGPGDLSFFDSNRHSEHFRQSNAGAVLVTRALSDVTPGPATRIVVGDVRLALTRVVSALFPTSAIPWGVEPSATLGRGVRWSGRIAIAHGATIGRDVVLGADCTIGRFAIVGDGVVLGERCSIGDNAVVGGGATLGNRVLVKAGARVGNVGFAYAESDDGFVPIPHVGGCYLEDDVEVGSNTTIDRGSIGDTVVGAGTKIDNLVQVAHNVRIGKGCLIMAQVGLAGSTVLEDDVLLAGQAGLAGHLKVGQGARVAAQAGVIGDVPAGSTVSGYPARPHREVLRQAATLRKLSRLTTSLERMVEADVKE